MEQAKVLVHQQVAGTLTQNESGFSFVYDQHYLENKNAQAVSLLLPLREKTYQSKTLFPFFDGLIPEGWLLEHAQRNLKIKHRDVMALLKNCCKDCIGAVSILPMDDESRDQ